ncbi:phosphatase [Agrobacterium tumefaciens]|uniref:metallophosphoesterase n=1 Tax=Agrobacterium tumefaciens TaxID=358 RepID=UPI0021CFFF58|nr:metallophosphoesterase [Agrobacterium tumefaciens]MCW8056456.1 metallophosphoesterase [Agrobacterium tumefaciens]MCW8144415.1 metallophosphoesterase [Agrobacterium tumefaciens]UXS08555.1 phosphatase [Agrobacterium tumefaciens]UXS15918.1 phosphatase [Agrobacterium tumefaciens]UXT64586.1 phosphatase [Agrobacterium tumefaciens]
MTEKTTPFFSFGIVADPQYADADPRPEMGRYYAESPKKLADAIDAFNREDLAFVVTLGDIIDRGFENFDAILAVYDKLRHRSVLLPGNHDFAVAAEHLPDIHNRLGMSAPWHDFSIGDVRFVVLDGNEVSLFAPPPGDPRRALAAERLKRLADAGAINAQDWNASFSDEQFEWLQIVLQKADAAGEKVIVLCHYPVYPENAHNMWDAPRILELLGAHPSVVAWFNGHNHEGNYGVLGHTHFVNFKGMVDTLDRNTFAIADVFADRIAIRGFGREEDRVLGYLLQNAAVL